MASSTNGKQSGHGPLAHIRVLDLCHARAGPTCVRVLADLGADVVQIVRPNDANMDASFPNFDRENLHRNKRSMALDLKRDAGRAVFYRLVKDADVVVGKWKDGRLGSVRLARPYGPFGGVVFRGKEVFTSDPKLQGGYAPMLEKVIEFFKTGQRPVPEPETLEVFAFMDAAQRSKQAGGVPTKLR